jgi:hypothetical protein
MEVEIVGDALSSLQDQYIFLTNNLDTYLGSCKKDADKDAITTNYVSSRRNYWNCIDKGFHDDDPKVIAAVQQVKTAQQNLKNSLSQLNDIASVIKVITEAVKIGSQLAALAG